MENGVDDVGVEGGKRLQWCQGSARKETELVEGCLEGGEGAVDSVESAVAAKRNADCQETLDGQEAASREGDLAPLALDVGGDLAEDTRVLGELGEVLLVALRRLAERRIVDLVDCLADRGETARQEGLPDTFRVHGQIRQGDEAAVGLAKGRPLGLLFGPACCQELPDSLAVPHGVVLAHQTQVLGLGIGVANVGEHGC